jgi:hypothetical protein
MLGETGKAQCREPRSNGYHAGSEPGDQCNQLMGVNGDHHNPLRGRCEYICAEWRGAALARAERWWFRGGSSSFWLQHHVPVDPPTATKAGGVPSLQSVSRDGSVLSILEHRQLSTDWNAVCVAELR